MSFNPIVDVSGRKIGSGEPTFIVAEIGASHAGKADLAIKLIEAAAKAGVDAVKLQTIDADESYVQGTLSYNIFKSLWFEKDALIRISNAARENKIILFSTPGDFSGLEMMLAVGMPLIKISSGLMTNTPLLKRSIQTGLPIVISTGMSYLDEVDETVRAAETFGCHDLLLMHCVALYPAPVSALNLAAMETMAMRYPCPVGYSDHFDGTLSCVAATAMGARILEKHFTLDRNLKGPDDPLSAEPAEMEKLVREVRLVEKMIGSEIKEPHPDEIVGRNLNRRCLVARRPIAKGSILKEEDIAFKRPRPGEKGLPPAEFDNVVGLKAARNIALDECIDATVLSKGE